METKRNEKKIFKRKKTLKILVRQKGKGLIEISLANNGAENNSAAFFLKIIQFKNYVEMALLQLSSYLKK